MVDKTSQHKPGTQWIATQVMQQLLSEKAERAADSRRDIFPSPGAKKPEDMVEDFARNAYTAWSAALAVQVEEGDLEEDEFSE
jgi:hypothetical protein